MLILWPTSGNIGEAINQIYIENEQGSAKDIAILYMHSKYIMNNIDCYMSKKIVKGVLHLVEEIKAKYCVFRRKIIVHTRVRS
jgi:hypothetical protein